MGYNEESAAKLGWSPTWFGAPGFGDALNDKIRAFQKSVDTAADGLCGPSTFRRMFTQREALEDADYPAPPKGSDYILCQTEAVPIQWDKVVHCTDVGGLKAPSGTYKRQETKRDVEIFVNHWDVALNSKSCHKILINRGISVHFLIDNDGTIYQTMDANHVAYHAGGRQWNRASIGVEISNAYYPKYQNYYTKRWGARPLITDSSVHGKTLGEHLGFYLKQMDAAKALWEALASYYKIPLTTPTYPDGKEYTTVYNLAATGCYRGIIHHYHLTKRKIDCGGFDLTKYVGK